MEKESTDVFECLEKIKFPKNNKRYIASGRTDVLTITFGITGLKNRTWESVKNKKYPMLYHRLVEFGRFINPQFKYSSITVNKNFKTLPHYDNNKGDSMIISVGNFIHGRLIVEGECVDIKNKPYYFNGQDKKHWTEDFQGTRYSIIYFTRNS